MIFLYAFLVGGLICAIGQIIQDYFKLTPGHITGLFVVIGVFLDFFDFYDSLIKFSGAGALLPITSFGHSMVDSALAGGVESGVLGISSSLLNQTTGGIVIVVVISVLIALIFKPKG